MSELEALAEGGIAVRRDFELLKSAARRLESLGLTACSRPLGRLLEAMSTSAKLADPEARHVAAGLLLGAYDVLRLAAD